MMNLEITRYLRYRKFNEILLMMTGSSKRNVKATSILLPQIHLFLSLAIAFFLIRFTQLHSSNLVVLIGISSLVVGSLLCALKVVTLIMHRKEIHELQDILDAHFNDLLKRNDLSDLILNKHHIYRFLNFCFTFLLITVAITYTIMPLLTIIYNHIHHIEPTWPILMYPTSYPWTVPVTGFVYYLHYLFEVSVNMTITTITLCVDSLFIFFTFLMTGHLREISYYITHIDEQNTAEVVVRKCMIRYSLLTKCRNHLEKIYGPIILSMIITNAVILCTLIYQLNQIKSMSVMKIVNCFSYVIVKLIQTFMYSWCGTNLTQESEDYRNAIYAANWYGNKRFMKAIIIMLKQKPLALTACKFTNVSLDIFTKILNTTISYYFLLKTFA